MIRLAYCCSFFFILIGISACLKDRKFIPPPDQNNQILQQGDLLINEIVSIGSTQNNEFGNSTDWFELYNPSTTDTIFLTANRWYFSDDNTERTKYLLNKDMLVLPDSFLVIWCDGLDTIANDVHTNFGLSGSGETIVLSYVDAQGNLLNIDQYTFRAITSGKSLGRSPDGSNNWITFDQPTLGSSNITMTNTPPPIDTIGPNSIQVNEILAKGSTQVNEFGTAEDWFELYNPSATDTIFLKGNQWEFRDAANTWLLPRDTFILPQSFLLVWCDGLDTMTSELHTNFSLSGNGDEVRLFFIPNSNTPFEVDSHIFGSQTAATSIGRSPDGSTNWISFTTPTPEASNL